MSHVRRSRARTRGKRHRRTSGVLAAAVVSALAIGLLAAPLGAIAAPTPTPSASPSSESPAPDESATPAPTPGAEPEATPQPEPGADPSATSAPAPTPTASTGPTTESLTSDILWPGDRSPRASPVARANIGILAAGIPNDPTQVYAETFEQGLNLTTPSALTAYASSRYTASSGWSIGTNCTGVLVNYTATYPNTSFCPTQPYLVVGQSSLAARDARRMADVLGQVAAGTTGSTSASAPANGSTTGATGTQSNHALVAVPYASVAGGTTVAQSSAGIGVSATTSRYYTMRVDAVGAQCGTNNASLSLNLVSGATTLSNGFPTPVVPCTSTGNVYYTSPTLPGLGTIGGILDPAWATSVRAATYSSSVATLLTPAQISAAQLQVVNTVTGVGSGFGVDNIRVLDATPALDMSFSPSPATSTVPTTLTYTITNTSDLLAKTDWGFTTTLPAGLVVAPTPAVGGTCTNVTGTAFAVTAAAGAGTIAAVGGDLAAAATSCTITVNVVAATAGTYSSGTLAPVGLVPSAAASLTVVPASTITLRKNITSRATAGDQFTLSVRSGATVLASTTTTGTATGIQSAQIANLVVQPSTAYTIYEAAASGAGLTYASSYECLRGTTVVAAGAFPSGTITMPDDQGAQIVCTFTNAPQTARLACDTNHFYSVSATGALAQADIVAGNTTAVGSWTGVSSANSLGVGAGGAIAYALERSSDATDVTSILKWTAAGGFQTLAGTAYATVAGGTEIAGSIVAGAVDLTANRYLFGKFNNSAFYIWSFTESNPAATQFQFVGSFPTGSSPNGNGDMAFDSRGNLYVLGAATVNNVASASIYTVSAATLAGASGGSLAVSSSTTKALNNLDATPAFGNVNGIAFSPRGTAYLSSTTSAYEFDPTTWTRIAGSPRIAVDSTDMGGCTSPATATVLKNVVGRAAAADQFVLTLANGGTTVATANTTGAVTGRQPAQIGPVPVPIGTTLTISEAMDTGSTSLISAYTTIYECWADGVRLSTGTTTTGTVTMPNRLSVNVVCTYFNSPRPASTVTITKQVITASGTAPAAGWTLDTTAVSTAGGAVTVLPSEAVQQQTNAAGNAAWTVLFGSTATRATLTVSEVSQSGYTFVSGTCTVNGAATAVTFTSAGGVVSGSIPNVASASTIACTFTNRAVASLTVAKRIDFGAALPTDWTLSATGPAGSLPGPSGITGTAATTGVSVTPGVAYRLAESGGALTYVQNGAWQCVDGTGAPVTVTAAGDVTLATAAAVTCTVGNATATITLLKNVLTPQTGFQAPNWTITATPAAFAGGTIPTRSVLGAEYSATGNPASTVEVRPGHTYTLSEAPTTAGSRLSYRELRIEQLVGSTWTTVSSPTITAPAVGQSAIYRFVNAPVQPTVLPLTGGTSTDFYLISGALVLAIAFAAGVIHSRRRAGRRMT